MKRKEKGKKTVRASAVCTALFTGLGCLLPVQANSGVPYWEGSDGSQIIFGEDNCPIVVKKENLVFDLQEFPEELYSRDTEAFLNLESTMTASYELYNPTDYAITARLCFPIGQFPDYGAEYMRESDGHQRITVDDLERGSVLVDGKAIETTIRHTLPGNDSLNVPAAGYAEDDFYTPDLKVTAYTWKVADEIEGLEDETVQFGTGFFEEGNRKYFFTQEPVFTDYIDNNGYVSVPCFPGQELYLYVLGDPLSQDPVWAEETDDEDPSAGLVESEFIRLVSKDEITLASLADRMQKPYSAVSETDWFNVFSGCLKNNVEGNSNILQPWDEYGFEVEASLERWYEYEITLDPGQTITNTVSAPVYPTVNTDQSPMTYDYLYYLSPAKDWAGLESLDIEIRTPSYLITDNINGFEKTEDGYALHLDGLPDQELSFTLSASANPTQRHSYREWLIFLPFIGLAALFALAIGFVLWKVFAKDPESEQS